MNDERLKHSAADYFAAQARLQPGQEYLHMIVVGQTAEWVTETILDLCARRFTERGAWSSLLPGPYPGEVMSIHTRRRRRRA